MDRELHDAIEAYHAAESAWSKALYAERDAGKVASEAARRLVKAIREREPKADTVTVRHGDAILSVRIFTSDTVAITPVKVLE